MYERKNDKLAPVSVFIKRMIWSVIMACILISLALFIGILGYHLIAGFGWIDSILEASMILGGMGPVNALQTNAGKIFASFYALYSGIILLASVGILVTPIFHRFMHRFHLELEDN